MRPDMTEKYGPEGLHREKYSSRKLRFLLLVCLFGIACLIWLRMGGPSVPCVFHELTGLQCPGCGVTRMILALSRLDLAAAMKANAFLTVTLPYLTALLVYSAYKWIKNEKAGAKVEASAVIYCIGLILFGVIRNLA